MPKKLIEEYKAAGVAPNDVFPQSFSLDDVLYWIEKEPEFGKQAVYLDGRTYRPSFRSSLEDMQELAEQEYVSWHRLFTLCLIWMVENRSFNVCTSGPAGRD